MARGRHEQDLRGLPFSVTGHCGKLTTFQVNFDETCELRAAKVLFPPDINSSVTVTSRRACCPSASKLSDIMLAE
jgi:hypothetical protein